MIVTSGWSEIHQKEGDRCLLQQKQAFYMMHGTTETVNIFENI